MKKIRIMFTIIFLLFLLSGCFHIEREIKVNKDGSGTLEETVLMSQQFIDQMKQMASSFGGGKVEEERDEAGYHDVEELKRDAAKMGKKVKYVSSKAMKKNNKLGYHVIYSFEDISKLSIIENPADNILNNTAMKEDTEDIKFKFKQGKTSELTICFPTEEEEDDYEEVEYEESVSDQDINMMKAMYAGMKISVKVIVDGKILETNATHQDGNVITLSEMDFDVIMENEEAFNALARNKEASEEEMKVVMQEFKGFKADMNDEVYIKFK